MLECSRVAQRLLRLLETRREDVRASVGAPRRAMGSQTTSRNVDAKRDRVLATLRGHLRYYTAQCESVQEHVLAMGSGESRCQRAFACLPCELQCVLGLPARRLPRCCCLASRGRRNRRAICPSRTRPRSQYHTTAHLPGPVLSQPPVRRFAAGLAPALAPFSPQAAPHGQPSLRATAAPWPTLSASASAAPPASTALLRCTLAPMPPPCSRRCSRPQRSSLRSSRACQRRRAASLSGPRSPHAASGRCAADAAGWTTALPAPASSSRPSRRLLPPGPPPPRATQAAAAAAAQGTGRWHRRRRRRLALPERAAATTAPRRPTQTRSPSALRRLRPVGTPSQPPPPPLATGGGLAPVTAGGPAAAVGTAGG